MTRSRADGYIAGVLQRTALISGFVVSLPALVSGVDGQGTPEHLRAGINSRVRHSRTRPLRARSSAVAFGLASAIVPRPGAPRSRWRIDHHPRGKCDACVTIPSGSDYPAGAGRSVRPPHTGGDMPPISSARAAEGPPRATKKGRPLTSAPARNAPCGRLRASAPTGPALTPGQRVARRSRARRQ